jgi:DNA polymerase-3 subunit epsilon
VHGVSLEQEHQRHDSPVRFAVVDVETSGLSARRHRLLQIGVVVVDAHGVQLDRWSSFVRPRRRLWFRLGPRRIHGINRRTLRHAPPADAVLDTLIQRIEGCVVVAHNAPFDLAFLHQAARRAGRVLPVHASLCTLSLSRRLDPERRQSHRLSAICERYGVVLDRPHDALADAEATAAVLPHLLAAHHITTIDQVNAQLVAA